MKRKSRNVRSLKPKTPKRSELSSSVRRSGPQLKYHIRVFIPFSSELIRCGVIIVQPPPRKIPRTIENTRENDETVCKPDDEKVLNYSSCSAIESTISTHG